VLDLELQPPSHPEQLSSKPLKKHHSSRGRPSHPWSPASRQGRPMPARTGNDFGYLRTQPIDGSMPSSRRSRSPSARAIILSEHGIDNISEDDYFLKSDNFRLWLKEDRGKVRILFFFHACMGHISLAFCSLAHNATWLCVSTLMNSRVRGLDITLPSLSRCPHSDNSSAEYSY